MTIPEGISEIASDVFACCENLTSVTIPSSITDIGMRAFSRCKNLRDCNVPNNVKVYPDAFSETPLEGKYQ